MDSEGRGRGGGVREKAEGSEKNTKGDTAVLVPLDAHEDARQNDTKYDEAAVVPVVGDDLRTRAQGESTRASKIGYL
jgi:hypothetical protein